MRKELIVVLLLFATACSAPKPEQQVVVQPADPAKVAEAKQVAETVSQKSCKLVDYNSKAPGSPVSIGIACPEEYRLEVSIQHLRYQQFFGLYGKRGTIKFTYFEPGFNEADISSPKNNESAAFYLTPES